MEVLLDNAIGPLGYYGAFTANMHTDGAYSPGSEAIIASALSREVPVVSAEQMLEWLDGRNGSTFTDIAWDGAHLTFGITVGAGANGLQGMLPMASGTAQLTNLTRGGSPVSYSEETVKGVSYATFTAQAGSYIATYSGGESMPPVITEGETIAVSMSEDGSPDAFSLTLHATDGDSSTLTWSIATPAAHGTAAASGTGASKVIGYTPTANYNSTDSFVVQVSGRRADRYDCRQRHHHRGQRCAGDQRTEQREHPRRNGSDHPGESPGHHRPG